MKVFRIICCSRSFLFKLTLTVLGIAGLPFVPTIQAAVPGKNVNIKVLSFNVHHCNPPQSEASGDIDVDAVARVIRESGADLVALQEIDMGTQRSRDLRQATLIAKKAGYSWYHFFKALDFDGGAYGVAILSKYPLEKFQVLPLPTDKVVGGEPRVLGMAKVNLPENTSIYFACTHLDAERKDSSRMMQVAEIIKQTADLALPVVLAGDLNAVESSDVIKLLDGSFVRTCSNCAPTISEDGHELAIDFIAYRAQNRSVSCLSHTVLKSAKGISDHLPVLAELQLAY